MVWDSDTEALLPLADGDQSERLAGGVRRLEFDHGLGPYPFKQWQTWTSLATFVTPPVCKL
jgi:hypothetical protein